MQKINRLHVVLAFVAVGVMGITGCSKTEPESSPSPSAAAVTTVPAAGAPPTAAPIQPGDTKAN